MSFWIQLQHFIWSALSSFDLDVFSCSWTPVILTLIWSLAIFDAVSTTWSMTGLKKLHLDIHNFVDHLQILQRAGQIEWNAVRSLVFNRLEKEFGGSTTFVTC